MGQLEKCKVADEETWKNTFSKMLPTKSKCAHIGTSREIATTDVREQLVMSHKKIFQMTKRNHSSPSWRVAGRNAKKTEVGLTHQVGA